MRQLKLPGLQLLVHVAALSPLALLLWDWAHDQLTANPIEAIQLRTGKSALTLLVLSLACTPGYAVSKLRPLLSLRRTLGLYAFVYASLHFLNFIGLDYGFDFALMREDVGNKRFVWAGLAAFLILLALAVTSSKGGLKRLGKNWSRLHGLVYVAAALALTHFQWQIKGGRRAPLVYAAIVIFLLVFRIAWIRTLVSKRWRQPNKQ